MAVAVLAFVDHRTPRYSLTRYSDPPALHISPPPLHILSPSFTRLPHSHLASPTRASVLRAPPHILRLLLSSPHQLHALADLLQGVEKRHHGAKAQSWPRDQGHMLQASDRRPDVKGGDRWPVISTSRLPCTATYHATPRHQRLHRGGPIWCRTHITTRARREPYLLHHLSLIHI